jgi:hypothetical protein
MEKMKKEEEMKKEIDSCTFQPKLNKAYKASKGGYLVSNDLSLYERQAIWQHKKNEK